MASASGVREAPHSNHELIKKHKNARIRGMNTKPKSHRGGLAFRRRWLKTQAAAVEKNALRPKAGEFTFVSAIALPNQPKKTP
jgi:hypothetical protein